MLTRRLICGIDWISASRETRPAEDGYWPLFKEIKSRFDGQEKDATLYGYRGRSLRTNGCGHIFYGQSNSVIPPREIIQAGGEVSDLYWRRIYGLSLNVSRLDLKVDVELMDPDPNLAKVYYDEIMAGQSPKKVNTQAFSLIVSTKGQTVYVGSRKSDAYGRVYDKGRQSGNAKPGKLWRYEVELKNHPAKEAARQIDREVEGKGSQAALRMIAGFVYEWFDARGIPPTFDLAGKNVDRIELLKQDGERDTLLWLRKSVSPSVRKFIGQGRGRDVYAALGIEDVHSRVRNAVDELLVKVV